MLSQDNNAPVSSKIEREDVPLNKVKYKQGSTCEEYLTGSRFINISFGTLSAIITLALLVQIHYGDYQVVPHGSVATDALECSEIGTNVLKKGGNSVDAAIASTFCLCVFAPHLTGLDADGQMLIYTPRASNPAIIIDFNNLSISTNLPRLVIGLAYSHRNYGKLPWKELVLPSVKYASDGFLVSKSLTQAVQRVKAEELFGRLETSQLVKIEKLAETLGNIAELSETQLDAFISGESGVPKETFAYSFTFEGYKISVPNYPSVAPVLSVILNEIRKVNDVGIVRTKKIVEIMRIIDEDFQLKFKFQQQGVSSNVAVIDKDNVYVSMITGLSSLFGSGEMTSSGYIMNSRNQLQPSRFPIVVVDSEHVCGRRIVFGVNEVFQATQLINSLLISGENSTESVENPRFHLLPTRQIGLEGAHSPRFDKKTEQLLRALSSQIFEADEPYDSVNIVEKTGDDLSSHSDSRGGGIASRFKRK